MATKICPSCRGNGVFSGMECDICGGFGGGRGGIQQACAPCNGTIPDYPCDTCNGKGVVLDVQDKASFAETQQIRYVRK